MFCSRAERSQADCRSKNVHHFPFTNVEIAKHLGMEYFVLPIRQSPINGFNHLHAACQLLSESMRSFRVQSSSILMGVNPAPLADRRAPEILGIISKPPLDFITRISTMSTQVHPKITK
jgi:hypothetical protein